MRESRITVLRNAFLSGLVLLAPIAVTWMVFSWLVKTVGGSFRPMLFPETLMDHPSLQFLWNILTMFLVLVLITGLGWLSRYVLAQFFTGLAERFILSIPGINTVYTTVKQVVDTFSSQNRNLFSKVALIEYPRKGIWTICFVTNKSHGEAQQQLPAETWTVFVPTTPNPTSGFMLFVPKDEIIELDMSVGDGMKMVISGGAVQPPHLKEQPKA
jgi:uncharacterized membrane protein